ncbi:hypothetical protein PPL_01101 [Heterostelium album PN500]|uniref:Uncharacterized protein n=1 Tax=Heterostelium pallidum (strain ATCC 26659 / Pp 5 / PN500) TaxID=670386 RepID=D3AY42_HETP5|nr:hypothetical protein PPL_01101 [Heterostelium album PN500]EFA85869.1 hypothetical protein PPL_01101 [Heterostelium album PN500]|eukprot:XP_020437975.1 hypothetical protein PPL_01101 [Heterostelium album PN500]
MTYSKVFVLETVCLSLSVVIRACVQSSNDYNRGVEGVCPWTHTFEERVNKNQDMLPTRDDTGYIDISWCKVCANMNFIFWDLSPGSCVYSQVPPQPSLYNIDLTDIVNITGLPHHRINFFPGVTPPDYFYFPNLEQYSHYKFIFRLNKSITWNLWEPTTATRPAYTSCAGSLDFCARNLLIIERGGRVKFNNSPYPVKTFMAIIVQDGGVFELDPTLNVEFQTAMIVLYPGSTFISNPQPNVNHIITPSYPFYTGYFQYREFDPFHVASFLCVGCNISIVSSRGAANIPASFASQTDGVQYCISKTYPTFNWTNPILNNDKVGLVLPSNGDLNSLSVANISYNVKYAPQCQEYYFPSPVASIPAFSGPVDYDPTNVQGVNFIYSLETSSNVNIYGYNAQQAQLVFVGNATVLLNGAVFDKLGTTNNSVLDDTTWDGTTLKIGNNIPDLYPITLLHVTNYVTIINNVFKDSPVSTSAYYGFTGSRFLIGAKRSFGTINNNAFLLRRPESTGIGFLYGTEEFDVSFNTFTTPYKGVLNQSSFGVYPDVRPGNTGIYTVSPYVSLTNNSFQGAFQGAPIIIDPLPNRAQLTGISIEPLIGKNAGQFQNNSQPVYMTWNKFLWSGMEENRFYRTALPAINNYQNNPPPLTLRLSKSVFYKCQSFNFKTKANTFFNYELVFDQSLITGFFTRLMGLSLVDSNNVFVGSYRGLTFVNSNMTMSFNQLTNSYFRDLIHVENSLFTSNISTTAQIQNYSPQVVYKNSPLSYGDASGYNTVSVFKVLPDPSIPITQASFAYTVIYDQYNTYLVNISVDGVPVITNQTFSNCISITVPITIPNFTPGLHKIEMSSSPTIKNYNGYFYRYSLSHKAGVVTNYNVQFNYNFYLGIDLNGNFTTRKTPLPIFGQQWTRCQWVSDICQISGGSYSKFDTKPSTITNGSIVVSDSDTIDMLTTYYGNSTGQGSSITINLQPGYYQLFLYYANPTNVQPQYTQSTSLPRFSVTINDQFVTPLTRTFANYQQYQRTSEYLIDNSGSSMKSYKIQWGYNGMYTPLSGVEIYSSLTTPYPIPNDPIPSTTTTATATATATNTASGQSTGAGVSTSTTSTTTGNNNEFIFTVSSITTHHSTASSIFSTNIISIILSAFALLILILSCYLLDSETD